MTSDERQVSALVAACAQETSTYILAYSEEEQHRSLE